MDKLFQFSHRNATDGQYHDILLKNDNSPLITTNLTTAQVQTMAH